jgi:hypothetical protein
LKNGFCPADCDCGGTGGGALNQRPETAAGFIVVKNLRDAIDLILEDRRAEAMKSIPRSVKQQIVSLETVAEIWMSAETGGTGRIRSGIIQIPVMLKVFLDMVKYRTILHGKYTGVSMCRIQKDRESVYDLNSMIISHRIHNAVNETKN